MMWLSDDEKNENMITRFDTMHERDGDGQHDRQTDVTDGHCITFHTCWADTIRVSQGPSD